MIRVGLIGPPDRAESIRLAIRLEERGAEGVALDSHQDPRIRVGMGEAHACGVDLTGFNALYVSDLGIRAPWVKGADGACDRPATEAALLASRRQLVAWNALLDTLAGSMKVVNPPRTHDLHALKPWEAAVYRRADLPLPLTLATSDPDVLTALPGEPRWGWIVKGMVGGYGYTEAFDPPSSAAQARERLKSAPLMLQERVEGDNVRAFVLDGHVIAAAEVVAAERGSTDSRRGETRLRRLTLPEEASRTAVRAAAHWGMPFCAVDFMRDSAGGRFLLLECNSSPFFVNFEKRSGCDITSPLADYLIARSGA